jgi:uncharacterized protein (TIGR03118 family)
MASSATSPIWVADNGAGVITLYSVDSTNVPTKVALTVSIPGDHSVTGLVFNTTAASFNGDLFLFVSEDGTVSGWRGALGTTAETLQSGSANNVYKGVTEATIAANSYLYAADFRNGKSMSSRAPRAPPTLRGTLPIPPCLPGTHPSIFKISVASSM